MNLARLRVILGAAVTWLVTAAAILTILIGELGGVAGIPPAVVRVLATALVVVTVAITIIRRVTVVLPAARGLLPTGQPNTGLEAIGVAALRNAHKRQHPATPSATASAKPLTGDPFERNLGDDCPPAGIERPVS